MNMSEPTLDGGNQTHVVRPPVHFTLTPSRPGSHQGNASKRKTASKETIEIQRDASATCLPTLDVQSGHDQHPLPKGDGDTRDGVPDASTEPECKR